MKRPYKDLTDNELESEFRYSKRTASANIERVREAELALEYHRKQLNSCRLELSAIQEELRLRGEK